MAGWRLWGPGTPVGPGPGCAGHSFSHYLLETGKRWLRQAFGHYVSVSVEDIIAFPERLNWAAKSGGHRPVGRFVIWHLAKTRPGN
jgi:hypothetical protein